MPLLTPTKLVALLAFLCITGLTRAQTLTDIQTARAKAEGTTVKIRGVATNGSELGTIRYFQDPTGGLAAYSNSMSSVKRGDSIEVTAKLKDYNNLLELDPVSNFTVISSNNAQPAPKIITAAEVGETYESQLITVKDAIFDNGGSTFNSNATHTFTTLNGETGIIFLRTGHPMVDAVIPTGVVSITGICSQFYDNYQILPRDINDIFSNSSINFTAPVTVENITTSGFRLKWSTNVTPDKSYIEYGLTKDMTDGSPVATVNALESSVDLSGFQPAQISYARAFSIKGTDTTFSKIGVYSTQSLSSGKILVYFTQSVDNTVSTGFDAVQIDDAVDDTLISFFNKAKLSIDFCVYNINNSGLSNMTAALNAAAARGVKVRVVYDGSTANLGLGTLNGTIRKTVRPEEANGGIMHNKFVILDAEAADPNQPWVWSGSANFTRDQINSDFNHVVLIQDQALARGYTLEFNEMFGGPDAIPVTANIRFGEFKTDNTPHEFIIGGKRVQNYFSPSDNTNARLLETIRSAQKDLHFGVMSFTRTDVAYLIRDRHKNEGIDVFGIVNVDTDTNGTVYKTLKAELGSDFIRYKGSATFHHKYLIVDATTPTANSRVFTGSHNWSSSADQRNDENTLIIHDPSVVNQFYQEFTARFNQFMTGVSSPLQNKFQLYPNPSNGAFSLNVGVTAAQQAEISIIDLTGKTVYSVQRNLNAGQNDCAIDAKLPAGLYVVQIKAQEGVATRKLIID